MALFDTGIIIKDNNTNLDMKYTTEEGEVWDNWSLVIGEEHDGEIVKYFLNNDTGVIETTGGFCSPPEYFKHLTNLKINMQMDLKKTNGIVVNDFDTLRFKVNDYNRYLKSDYWQKIRDKKLEEAGYQCQFCYSKEDLHVHHLTYDYLCQERLSALIVLCETCHSKIHNKHKNKQGKRG